MRRVLLAFLFLLAIRFASAQTYAITDLGQLTPSAINTWGQVVGNDNNQAYIWDKWRGMKSLGSIPGGTFSYASSINDHGAVTGTAYGPGTSVSISPYYPNVECPNLGQPFLWSPKDGMVGLGVVFPAVMFGYGDFCIPFYTTGINDRDQIVGYTAGGPDLYQFDLLWTSTGGFTLFGNSWWMTTVNGVNNANQIVGQNGCSCGIPQAATWKNTVVTVLETLIGKPNPDGYQFYSSAMGINDQGQMAGWSSTTIPASDEFCDSPAECPMHAVLWTKTGAIRDLGTLPGDTFSTAVKINLFGKVIGTSGSAASWQEWSPTGVGIGGLEVVGRPFLWSANKGMRDLNMLIPVSDWVLNSVSDINVWGQIVGSGTLNGESHGFLLTPDIISF